MRFSGSLRPTEECRPGSVSVEEDGCSNRLLWHGWVIGVVDIVSRSVAEDGVPSLDFLLGLDVLLYIPLN
jgi:hypothetical protein